MQNEGDTKKYASLIAGYRDIDSRRFDEMWSKEGTIQPHWRDFMRAQERFGPDDIDARKLELDGLLRENGVTYNAYTEGASDNRPWDLDPCPLVLAGDEWGQLEPALIQRGELLNALYKDLYGPQRLMKARILPPDLIFQHPGFCRAAVGMPLPGQYALVQSAFNLVRGTDKQWWVLSDRLQTMQGAGYALETRLAMSRVYPNLIRHCEVQRLAEYFRHAHQSLVDAAEVDDPHVVLLSPGPSNESYFEDAYLANYQGYTLVQGDDLVVRDGYVWLKTLHGLKKVDVILRRISDQFSDPLSLRPDSFIGVPGLIESMRQRKVVVVNPIGGWLLESPGLYPFLERCCQYLLGEPLKIPSAATWWCGQPTAFAHVIKNIDKMVVKHVSERADIAFGHLLSKPQQQQLIDRIKQNPAMYVGQQMLNVSTMPSWTDQQLKPRHGFLRTFMSASRSGYQLMPGGLACVAREQGQSVVNTQAGAVNKDTWVRASEAMPLRPYAPKEHGAAVQERELRVISSRTAENLFWLGRYSQRAEMVARIMRQVINSFYDEFSEQGQPLASAGKLMAALRQFTDDLPLIADTGAEVDLNQSQSQSQSQTQSPDITAELYNIAVDKNMSRGMHSILASLHRSAFHSRDVWSNDSWRVIDDIGEVVTKLRGHSSLGSLQRGLDKLLSSLMALNGLIADSMNHDDGWRMLDIGRLLERTINLSHLLEFTVSCKVSDNETEVLTALLSANDNEMNYRRYYRGEMDAQSVLDYVLLNRFNPRGMVYQLDHLQQHIRQIFADDGSQISAAERSVLSAYSQVQLADVSQLVVENEVHCRPGLTQLMKHIQQSLEVTSSELSNECFVHSQKSRSSEWSGSES
ncbi:circularly permuted type 2 ATP-grasp protein [Corallincola spongiicola]|uniref:DUF403 domain-containing protein n=1 Tax=Corallincola spongiicola TaxID=2520508 RepID=A0ABY1WLX7_9GAMM|nr:circularly permuted type 2 ATP-grasp protein [Corallincola spongiicola]TAA42595.1 hypothetical protein EXY25_14995 [Corallincola spongiicola]